MENAVKQPQVPDWQRDVCGLFAVMGVFVTALAAWVFLDAKDVSIGKALMIVSAEIWDTFQFGHVALKGKLPFGRV